MTAERLMLLAGTSAFLLTLYWVRSRDLREKYAVIWLAVASCLLLIGLFPGLIMAFADASRLSYPAAVLFVALAAISLFSMSVSVSLTHQHRNSVRLMQEVALLRERLDRVSPPQAAGGMSGLVPAGDSTSDRGTAITASGAADVLPLEPDHG